MLMRAAPGTHLLPLAPISPQVYNKAEGADGDGPAECGAVLARSAAALPMVAHPCVMGVCEGVLGRQVRHKGPLRPWWCGDPAAALSSLPVAFRCPPFSL